MKKPTESTPATPEFQNAIDLLAVLTEASNRLALIEAAADQEFIEIVDEFKKEFAQAQEAATKATSALETICRSHPEWFQTARTIKTPYGKVSFHRATRLEIPDEEATCRLLVAILGETDAASFIRHHQEADKEALALLPPETLARVMVREVVEDHFTAAPAKMEFGKAVQTALKAEANAGH